ncbi:MAG: GNAT family N-acetyltransferase [Acidimicrobiia bacterium]|nr:GNAT family N-acetyltransferase [Acidimicrobiia bacterium]
MIEVRTLEPADTESLEDFFRRVPEEDRAFFKEDVFDPATLDRWAADHRSRRLLALESGHVRGYVAVVPGIGLSDHVGEIRVVVDPAHRRRGLGRGLARRGLLEALGLGLRKVVVEASADQEATIALFRRIGFEAEGILAGHVRDRAGGFHDLVVLAHQVDATWAELATAGITDEMGGGS